MTTLFENMLDNAIDQINSSLNSLDNDHEVYEVDDVTWSETEDIFQIPVFRFWFTDRHNSEQVDRFRFYRRAGETDEEVSERFVQELNEFCRSW